MRELVKEYDNDEEITYSYTATKKENVHIKVYEIRCDKCNKLIGYYKTKKFKNRTEFYDEHANLSYDLMLTAFNCKGLDGQSFTPTKHLIYNNKELCKDCKLEIHNKLLKTMEELGFEIR